MDRERYYAPILIPTLCRYKHFVRCVESLKKNDWAKFTDVYIALDYPSKSEHFDGYNKICEYLKGDFSQFSSFIVIRRSENFGSVKNARTLCELVLQKYDRFIRTDDDMEFSPNFIEYMDKCLAYYEGDNDVIAVNGYTYPLDWHKAAGCNVIKNNLLCTMWGVGFWKDKYLEVSSKLRGGYLVERFDSALKDKSYKKLCKARFLNFVEAGLSANKGLTIMSSDVAWGTYLALAGKYVVMPTISKARNHGFDGSGVYCQEIPKSQNKKLTAWNYNYKEQSIDQERSFTLIPDESIGLSDDNRKLLDAFDTRDKDDLFKANLKLLLYKYLGRRNYFKLRDVISHAKTK